MAFIKTKEKEEEKNLKNNGFLRIEENCREHGSSP